MVLCATLRTVFGRRYIHREDQHNISHTAKQLKQPIEIHSAKKKTMNRFPMRREDRMKGGPVQ